MSCAGPASLSPPVLQAGQSVTLEPGGQFELSGATLESLHQTCAEVNSHLYQASQRLVWGRGEGYASVLPGSLCQRAHGRTGSLCCSAGRWRAACCACGRVRLTSSLAFRLGEEALQE